MFDIVTPAVYIGNRRDEKERTKGGFMSILRSISKPQDRPIIATITGDPGVGKTSLAATFPKPIFVRAEDGLQSIPIESRPDALPLISSVDSLWEQLTALINEEHDYQTIVIDSVTELETMFGRHVIESDPKKPKSLAQAQGGYGAGFQAVAALHARVRRAAQVLNDKGLHVIFIAHSDVTTIEPPDGDSYTRYDLRLHKKSMTHYVDNVDMVAYLKLQMFTHGDGDRKKAVSDGSREAVCHTSASNISKNRYSIDEPLQVQKGVNPFVGVVPCL